MTTERIKLDDPLWVHIAYKKLDDGKIDCRVTSNIPHDRGIADYDMKVYAGRGKRVYEQFTVVPGESIHIDVYSGDGEYNSAQADFNVTDQAVEVEESDVVEVSVSPQE